MALKLSKNAQLTDIVSDANPITTTHPTSGSAQVVPLWVFNDDPAVRYEAVTADPTDATGGDESTWIALSLDNTAYLAGGAVLTVGNLATANQGVPIYARVTTPAGQSVQNKGDIKITLNGNRFAV